MRMRRAAGVAGVAVAVLVACETSTGPEFVDRVAISPDSVYLEVGQSATFEALPLGPRDQEFVDRAGRVEWGLVSSGPVTLAPSADGVTATAVALGSTQVTAALGRGEGRAAVHVQPAGLASIEVQPNPIVMQPFQGRQIRAVLRNAQGEEMSPEGFRVSWQVENEAVAFQTTNIRNQPISSISARSVGTTRIKLIVGPLVTFATVRVEN